MLTILINFTVIVYFRFSWLW